MGDFNRPVGGVASPRRRFEEADEMELRAGVDPLNRLLAERQKLVEEVADLRAKYGGFGTFDHLRKIELSRIKSLIRLQAMRENRKVTNDVVDEEAHEHPDYTEFVKQATQERARYFRLEAQVEAIDYRINRGQSLLRFAASEPRT